MKARVDSKLRGRPAANTIIWFGDSITFNGGRTDYAPTAYNSNGFWCWAQFLLGHLFTTLGVQGVTGQQTPGMLPRLMDVVSKNPGWVHILAGTNDITHGGTYAGTTQNLDFMLATFEGAGIRVILGTIPPNGTGLTAVQRLYLMQVNQWIREQARVRQNVIVVDYYAALVSASTGNFAGAGMLIQTNDNVHPNTLGAYNMGVALANAVKAAGVQGGFDLFSDDVDTTNCLLDGQMQAGGVGSSPTGWVGSSVSNSGSVAYSKTARTDLPNRSWQTVTITPTTGGASAAMTLTNPNARGGAWAIGDTVVGTMEASISALDQAPATLYQAGVSLGLRFVGGSGQADDMLWVNGVTTYNNHPAVSRYGVFRTPPAVVPAGTTAVELLLTIGGGGTYNFDRGGIFNVSRYGLTA